MVSPDNNQTVIDVFRFYDEYDFLQARLAFIRQEFAGKQFNIRSIAYIPSVSNSGVINLIDLDKLHALQLEYDFFRFHVFHIPESWTKSSSRSSEDYSFDYISDNLRQYLNSNPDSILSFSDLDEVYDTSLLLMASIQLEAYDVSFSKMMSHYFRFDIVFKEHWPGTVFLRYSSLAVHSLGTLKYSAHHALNKNNTIYGGHHLSYFQSSYNSKRVNSHFVNGFAYRFLLASLGINPALRLIRFSSGKKNIPINIRENFSSLQSNYPFDNITWLRAIVVYLKFDIFILLFISFVRFIRNRALLLGILK